jgi:hypothetical protein
MLPIPKIDLYTNIPAELVKYVPVVQSVAHTLWWCKISGAIPPRWNDLFEKPTVFFFFFFFVF